MAGCPRQRPELGSSEKKTKRVQLIMQPSLYARLKREADEENTSFNNYIHDLLRSYINALEEGESEENV